MELPRPSEQRTARGRLRRQGEGLPARQEYERGRMDEKLLGRVLHHAREILRRARGVGVAGMRGRDRGLHRPHRDADQRDLALQATSNDLFRSVRKALHSVSDVSKKSAIFEPVERRRGALGGDELYAGSS